MIISFDLRVIQGNLSTHYGRQRSAGLEIVSQSIRTVIGTENL